MEDILAFIRNVFYVATHQQKQDQSDFVIPPFSDPGKITLYYHRIILSSICKLETPKNMNIQEEEEKKEEEKQVQKDDKKEIEEEEEEDFIPFTKEKPVKQESDIVQVINTIFEVSSKKQRKQRLYEELQVCFHSFLLQ